MANTKGTSLADYPTRYEREQPCPKCGSKIFYKKKDRCVKCMQALCVRYQKGIRMRNNTPNTIIEIARRIILTDGAADAIRDLKLALAVYDELVAARVKYEAKQKEGV